VGYTPYYVAATWYGYDNRIKRIYLTSEEANQPMYIWKAVMEKIHENLDPREFSMPDQIVSATVCIYSGKAPTDLCRKDPRGNAVRTQYFIKNTEPRTSNPCNVHTAMTICSEGSQALGKDVLMGLYCPEECAETKTVITRSIPFIPLSGDPYPADWGYEAGRAGTCTFHTELDLLEDLEELDDLDDTDDPDDTGESDDPDNPVNPDDPDATGSRDDPAGQENPDDSGESNGTADDDSGTAPSNGEAGGQQEQENTG